MALIKINKNTQRAQRIIDAYVCSDTITLWEAYERFSHAKERAYNYCLDLMSKMNGYAGCITGHNTCTFSYAFRCGEGMKDLVYITHCGDYIIYDAFAE